MLSLIANPHDSTQLTDYRTQGTASFWGWPPCVPQNTVKCVPQCISVQGYINRRESVMGTEIIWLTIYLTVLFKQFPGQILLPLSWWVPNALTPTLEEVKRCSASSALWQGFKTLMINKVMTSLRHIPHQLLSLPVKPLNPSLLGKGKKQSMGFNIVSNCHWREAKKIFSYPPPLR